MKFRKTELITAKECMSVAESSLHIRTQEGEPTIPIESSNDVLDFAIAQERRSYYMYRDIYTRVEDKTVRKLFKSLAEDELRHKAKLESIKAGKISFDPAIISTTNCRMTSYIASPLPAPHSNYQRGLLLAIIREKDSIKFYLDLATRTTHNKIQNLLVALALEEIKHTRLLHRSYLENSENKN